MPLASETVVVTGVSSFVGCHLALDLLGRGRRVVGAVSGARRSGERLERVEAVVRAGGEQKVLDMTDPEALGAFVAKVRPDLWLHHAGWTENYASPDYDLERGFAINVAPLAALYPALAHAGCRGVIVTGTDAEYGPGEHACREDEACMPAMPYGLSKLAETIRAAQLAERYALPTRVARLFIPYGPMDAPQKLIPSVIAALKKGRPISLTACEQQRDFLHVRDAAACYATMADRMADGALFEIFNVCAGTPVRLKDFLLDLARMLGADPALLRFGERPMRPGEPPIRYGDAGKARTLLSFAPRPLNQGLAELAG